MKLPHQSNIKPKEYNLAGYKALIITTSQSTLDKIDPSTGKILRKGKPTGVYASELTEPYYCFLDAKMQVDVASISGGEIPIEKFSLLPLVRTEDDSRFLKDLDFRNKTKNSLPMQDVDISTYDIVFLSGGWGAAYDFAQNDILATKMSDAYASKKIIGAVCHGPLGLVSAKKPDGSLLVDGVKITGVSNKQLKELMVGDTPKHPETELKKSNAIYSKKSGVIDAFQNHIEVDKEHLIVTGQNQKGGVLAAQTSMELFLHQINR
jgi:putative intracellular protease/amidase